MEVRCDEGVAIRIGPEPGVVGREAGGEASAGDRTGQPSSGERTNRSADAVCQAEGDVAACVSASMRSAPRGQRPWHVRTLLAREPEISRSTTGLGPSGPRREGDEPKPAMHEREKSDPAIVATKPANAPARAEAERVGAKGGGQGERARGRRAPDTEPARRVPRPGPRAASRTLRRQHPRWEPDALIGPVRFCAGARPVMGVPTPIANYTVVAPSRAQLKDSSNNN